MAIYSSFLQRAYDQILHDVCIQKLPVVFAIDRAGLVGSDGETHQGIFDLSYLSEMPNMTIMAPKNKFEVYDMINFSVDFNHPLAIRYPRGTAYEGLKEFRQEIRLGKSEYIYKEKDIALFAIGSMVETAVKVRELLKKDNYNVTLVNARFIRPIDEDIIMELSNNHNLIITLEENVLNGGFGEKVNRFILEQNLKTDVVNIAVPNIYVEHGNVSILRKEIGIDCDSIVTKIKNRYKSEMN